MSDEEVCGTVDGKHECGKIEMAEKGQIRK